MGKLWFAIALFFCSFPLISQSTKAVADQLCHDLRELQNPDGSYGADLTETCRVLDVLGRAPRRYSELDGPFIRNAARLVARAPAASIPDAWIALALAGSVSVELQQARDAAIARLVTHIESEDYDALLALRTVQPDLAMPPREAESADPALRCLVSAQPGSITPPPATDIAAWTRWARAARLRGVTPVDLPELPSADAASTLRELVATLETVIQMHGLASPTTARAGATHSAEPKPARVAPGNSLEAGLERASAFFDAAQKEGTFGLGMPGWDGPEPGVTALCLSAAMSAADLRHQPRPAWIAAGLDYLKGLQHDDGSIHEHGLDVYTTSVAIEALVAGGRDEDRAVIERARKFLLLAQADETEGYEAGTDIYYGGIGYGNDERPDLSNSQFALEAATAAGTSASDPFFRKALVFIGNCQNLAEASGATEWPRSSGGKLVMGNDGGGTYMPGDSEAGEVELAHGVYQAVSYGSMTYALVKSYLFCSVPADDPRLQSAVRWLARNFTLDTNPGFVKADAASDGLFYYYLSMARTLRMLPDADFRDEQGQPIPWRSQLMRRLLDSQRMDGSWTNDGSSRWWESAPTLCSAYAVLALAASSG